jgi:hypothetical protein
MDKLGRANGTSPNEIRAARKAERRQKPTILRSDSLTMAAALTKIPVKIEPEPQLHCPLCPHNHLFRGKSGFWNHMESAHHPGELLAALKAFPMNEADPLDDVESTLIRIVNSLDHESAIEIATAALCGKTEGES